MAKALSGKTLKRLSDLLSQRIASVSWLFGFSSAQWIKNSNRGQGELLVQHSLMIRMLLERPELSPIPSVPTVQEVYELLCEVDPAFTRNNMSTMVGLSIKSTARIFDGGTLTSTVSHMLLIIKNELLRLKTKKEKQAFYRYLQKNVSEEAESRGYCPDRVLKEMGWSVNSVSESPQ